jgi:hypothetical protein
MEVRKHTQPACNQLRRVTPSGGCNYHHGNGCFDDNYTLEVIAEVGKWRDLGTLR